MLKICNKNFFIVLSIVLTISLNLCACKSNNISLSNVEESETLKDTESKESADDGRKIFYDMYGYRRTRGLQFEDGELHYYEDGYKQYDKVIEASRQNLLDVIIDKDGIARLDKKCKKNLYKRGEIDRTDENATKVYTLPYVYSDVSYSLSYSFVYDKLHLRENGYEVKKYKNQFHTYRKTDEGEIVENINMPEDDWGAPRFDYLGEMKKRPREETYYFFEDSSLAFDGVHEIDKKKYLFNDRGVLVKNGSYFNSSGIGHLSDAEGIVIEKEGFHVVKPYDEKGNLDINCSYVSLFDGGDPFVEKLYYVNSNGEIERNRLFVKSGGVYYSNEDGVLIRNSFLTNKYYFGNDYRLIDDSINETNVEEVEKFIDCAFKNGSYDTQGHHEIYQCKLLSKNKADEYKEKVKKFKKDPNKVIDEDYMTIVKDNDKAYINGELVRNKFVYDGDIHVCVSAYCDGNGRFVKNDLVNIGKDIYLIDKYGSVLTSHKLTKWVIRYNFEGKTIDKLMQYENYFVDDTGRILFEYHDICENLIKNAKMNSKSNSSKVIIPQNMYNESIEEIVKKENAFVPPEIENGFKVKEIYPSAFELPFVWKTVLIDINNDGTNELLVFKKDYLVYKRDNWVDDFEEGIHPRMYFITADLYKYEKDGFKLLHSRKLKGCFYRYGELLRVGFKKGNLDRWLMYVEWRGESYGGGSFVEFKYYDFDNEKINLNFTTHVGGSSVGEDALYLHEIVSQTGVDYKESRFYNYKDSYLEQDADCKLVLGINKDYAFGEEDNYSYKYLLPVEIVNYGEDKTTLE